MRSSAAAWLLVNVPACDAQCLVIPWIRLTPKGYARIRVDGRMTMAHRFVYETFVGVIPDGLETDHTCNNRACCNPAHLQLLTHADNVREITRRGRHHHANRTHCKRSGHPLEGDNVIMDIKGHRACRTCANENQRRWKRKMQALSGIVAVVAACMVFPLVAFGHHNTVSCQSPGVWLIVNSEVDKTEHYTTDQGHEGDIGAGGSTTVSYSGTSLTVYGVWSNGVTNTATGEGDCTEVTTTTTELVTTTTAQETTTSTSTSTPATTSTTLVETSTTAPGSTTTSTSSVPSTTQPAPSCTDNPTTPTVEQCLPATT